MLLEVFFDCGIYVKVTNEIPDGNKSAKRGIFVIDKNASLFSKLIKHNDMQQNGLCSLQAVVAHPFCICRSQLDNECGTGNPLVG